MMEMAALPLAEVESIRFSSPLMITLLSAFVLGEKVVEQPVHFVPESKRQWRR